ncbi:MAG: hypothetical protein HKN87_04080 [Saprospiraceae bacterium]|nr:hypothetical protein [Saprospiraceae bacterium]
MFRSIIITILTSIVLSQATYGQRSGHEQIIKGVYGSPQSIWDAGYELRDLGINAIFVRSTSLDSSIIIRARHEDQRIFVEFPTLNGKNYVNKHPEAWAINEQGQKVQAASWFMGVCPTDPAFRRYRFDQLDNLLSKYAVDGIWMDYVHWHAQFEERRPILPETCFCEHCRSAFSRDKGIELPPGDLTTQASWILSIKDSLWRQWRCEVIVDWVQEIRAIMDQYNPEMLLGMYHCPWTDDEFNGARQRILGLDYNLLSATIDVFSPMVYHGRMERNPTWVADHVQWICDRLRTTAGNSPKVWPIVQASDQPHIVSAKEFRQVLKAGLSKCASGVMMFTGRSVVQAEQKIRVLREVYLSSGSDE